ncbi:HECT domain [Pyrenophora seminiperda CCB06]|uniref:HECT-type E3 ubiquitin transferase n=1 Tax=Pyrenophora seminiperda CCB06 TaxID=1302712 RepID=A0A3M7MJI3_9PLEO|nr:HECT domain [Pyrenophora seminiperda CCB06]
MTVPAFSALTLIHTRALIDNMSASQETECPHDAHSSVVDASPPPASAHDRQLWQPSSASSEPHVVDVQDPNRILECSQVERQRRFQHLILHGCKSVHCDTPTCFSSHQRHASKPYRPPTHLTATALAHYLASQDNPKRGLCPHELKVEPASLELGPSLAQESSHGTGEDYAIYPSVSQLAHQYRHPCAGGGESGMASGKQHDHTTDVRSALIERQQARKDPKALGQNLYDSLAVIYNYTKQIPSPSSVLASLRINHHVVGPDISAAERSALPTLQTGAGHIPYGHSETPRDRKPPPFPHSLAKRTPHEDLNSGNSAAAFLSNGQQVHKIPYHPPRSTRSGQHFLATDTGTLDGNSDPAIMSISKTGKKSFTIGGTSPSVNRVPKQSPAAGHENTHVQQITQGVPIIANLNCNLLDQFKEEVQDGKDRSADLADLNYVVDYDSRRRTRPSKPAVNRSLFYTLSNTETLLASFHDSNQMFRDSPLPHLDSSHLANSFQDWNRKNGALIYDSLWLALEDLFTPPPELDVQKSPRLRPSRKGASADSSSEHSPTSQKPTAATKRYLNTHQAAHIVMICIHALTSLVSIGWPHTWSQIRKFRSWGIIIPSAAMDTDAYTNPYMEITDELEYEPAVRLADRLLRAIGTRTCFEHILSSLKVEDIHNSEEEHVGSDEALMDVIMRHLMVVERVALARKLKLNPSLDRSADPGWTVTATFMEWLRTIILKKWDNKAEINKWSSVGTAVITLARFHANCATLNLLPSMFKMPIFNEHLDMVTEPVKFLFWKDQPNTLHILQYPFFFLPKQIVGYFRTINFTEMMKHHDHTLHTSQMRRGLALFLREPHFDVIRDRLRVTLSEQLILDVSRENPLKDTLDQLWGQEKRMLLKPLKVKMGHEEGEIGLDHGGVTYEFFRVVLSEAFQPENGMFTIDPQTYMTWFQPYSLEPCWKYEMLGILFSLAVYNGITLPVTFPLAFYNYLWTNGDPFSKPMSLADCIVYIKDGWPTLATGFEQLLSWTDDNVEDVFSLDYVFNYEVYGQRYAHDLAHPFTHSRTPPPSDDPQKVEAPPVTNANREAYIRDYTTALTHTSILPQLSSFHKGFQTCISARSLSLFTPASLRHLIEGDIHISLSNLKRCARYGDGYTATHSTVRMFWDVVEKYGQDDCRRLLEFVTASDRVPVTGYESITFAIHKIAGAPNALPSSSTCFGKLYLPEYEAKEGLAGKLGLAIRNSKGFGVA